MSALWHHTAAPLATPPLVASGACDLVVIGAGFTGLSAALEAARRGASVVVLEAGDPGHGGSGRNVGLVNAGLWLPPAQVVAQMGEGPGRRLVEALAQGPARVWQIIAREGIDCEATPQGTLHLAHAASGLRDLSARHDQARAWGWPVQLLDAAETARRTGSAAFHGALYDPRAGTIQPLAYARGLARAALRAGARIHGQSPVQSVQRDGGWRVTCKGHEIRAGALLLATNAYFQGIEMAFRPRFVPVHYFQLATQPLTEPQRARILPGGEGCWDTALVMSSIRTDWAGRLILGGIGSLEGPGRAVHADWARRKLAALYPDLRDLAFDHAWSGRIAMTSDHIPKIVSLGARAHAAFGYSGRGIAPGTVFGTALAEALLEDRPEVLPLTPVASHDEILPGPRAAWVEGGAVLTHALACRRP